MNYINPNSRKGLVNKFADFIVNELTKEQNHLSKIEVTLFETFFVINGFTESNKVLDMSDIQTKFFELNQTLFEKLNIKNINTIDVIRYGTKPVIPNEQHFKMFNSKRPIFKREILDFVTNESSEFDSVSFNNGIVIDKPQNNNLLSGKYFIKYGGLSVSSEYPYGYSLNSNRSYLYYTEYICNHLFRVTTAYEIKFKFSTIKDVNNEDFLIDIKSDSNYKNSDLKSLVLDVFDFNLNKFINEKMLNYDLTLSLDNQIGNLPWLINDRSKDLILF